MGTSTRKRKHRNTNRIVPERQREERIIERAIGEEEEIRLRDFRIEKKDVMKHGPTQGCQGPKLETIWLA